MSRQSDEFDWKGLLLPLTTDFKEDFRKCFSSWDIGEQLKFSNRLMNEISNAVSLDDDTYLHSLCWVIDFLEKDHESLLQESFQTHQKAMENLVTLAARLGKENSLRYMSTRGWDTLLSLPQKLGGNAISPGDVDEYNHTAFYYAMKSKDASLIRIVCEGVCKDLNSQELDMEISRAYSELKTRNVRLSHEVDAYIIGKLVDLRFFSTVSHARTDEKKQLGNILGRVQFLLESIHNFKEVLMNFGEGADIELSVLGKRIAKDIHVLKHQLKLTYDVVPWEEMEFCLVLFVRKFMQPLETDLLYCSVLRKDRLTSHLEHFADALESQVSVIKKSNVRVLGKYPEKSSSDNRKKDRSDILAEIKNRCPPFANLYDDYEKVRDFHSLEMMKTHVDLVSGVDFGPAGQVVITRALQVVGESLKKSVESPKLSLDTAEYLLNDLQADTRNILEQLRNSISHEHSLSLRDQVVGYGEPFFRMLKADIGKINSAITKSLLWRKKEASGRLFSQLLQCQSVKEAIRLLDTLHFSREVLTKRKDAEDRDKQILHKSLNDQLELIQELRGLVPPNVAAEQMFQTLNAVLRSKKEDIAEELFSYYYDLKEIHSIALAVENKFLTDAGLIRLLDDMKKLTATTFRDASLEIDLKDLTIQCLDAIVRNVKPHITEEELKKVTACQSRILNTTVNVSSEIRWLKELKSTFGVNKKGNDNQDQIMASKLRDLGKVFGENNLFATTQPYEENIGVRSEVDMLVLDIMSMLSNSHFSHNPFFLDNVAPMVIGKNLRNHLAHYNVLYEVALEDPPIQILRNGAKILSVLSDTPSLPHKIDQVQPCDIVRLRTDHDRDLRAARTQKSLYEAARRGDVEGIACAVAQGADVDGRTLERRTCLHLAAGHYEACRLLCSRLKADPRARDIDGRSPLHAAARAGGCQVIAFLVAECHVPVDTPGDHCWTPLHVAAESGQAEAIQVLLELGAESLTEIEDSRYITAHLAALNHHVEALNVLVDSDPRVLSVEAGYGLTLEHFVAGRHSVEIIRVLQEMNVRFDARDDLCRTPLHNAAMAGNCEVIRSLVEGGADVNTTSLHGITPLHCAADFNKCEAVQTLLTLGADPNLAHETTLRNCGYPNIHDYLMESSLDKTVRTLGVLPLMSAAMSGCADCVRTLLRGGARVNARDKKGQSALHLATVLRNGEAMRALLEEGADPDGRKSWNQTPLHIAAMHGEIGTVQILLDAKTDVNARDQEGETPLRYAITNGHPEAAGALLRAGADPDDASQYAIKQNMIDCFLENGVDLSKVKMDDASVLHYAVVYRNATLLRHCLERNCDDVNSRDVSGSTPLHRAAATGNLQFIEQLLDNGADIHQQDDQLRTPLDSAVLSAHQDCVELLLRRGSTVTDLTLYVAVGQDSAAILERLLLDEGASEGIDMLLLHEAAVKGSAGAVGILAKPGADIDAGSLHLAALQGHREVVQVLLSKGANPNAILNDGFTPLLMAILKGRTNVMPVLLEHGADPFIRQASLGSSFELAVVQNNLPALRMLQDHVNRPKKDVISVVGSDDSPSAKEVVKNNRPIATNKTPLKENKVSDGSSVKAISKSQRDSEQGTFGSLGDDVPKVETEKLKGCDNPSHSKKKRHSGKRSREVIGNYELGSNKKGNSDADNVPNVEFGIMTDNAKEPLRKHTGIKEPSEKTLTDDGANISLGALFDHSENKDKFTNEPTDVDLNDEVGIFNVTLEDLFNQVDGSERNPNPLEKEYSKIIMLEEEVNMNIDLENLFEETSENDPFIENTVEIKKLDTVYKSKFEDILDYSKGQSFDDAEEILEKYKGSKLSDDEKIIGLGDLSGHSENEDQFTNKPTKTKVSQTKIGLNDEVGIVSLEDLFSQGDGDEIISKPLEKEFPEINTMEVESNANISFKNLFEETSENEAFTDNTVDTLEMQKTETGSKSNMEDILDYSKEGQSFNNTEEVRKKYNGSKLSDDDRNIGLGDLFGHSENEDQFTNEPTASSQTEVDLNDEDGIASLEDLFNQVDGGGSSSNYYKKEFSEVNIGLENLFEETSKNNVFTENTICTLEVKQLDNNYVKSNLEDNLYYSKERIGFDNTEEGLEKHIGVKLSDDDINFGLGALFGHSEFTKESTEAPQSDVDLNDEVGIVSLEDIFNQSNEVESNPNSSKKEFSEINMFEEEGNVIIGLENLFETSENEAFTENTIGLLEVKKLDNNYEKSNLEDNLDYSKERQSFDGTEECLEKHTGSELSDDDINIGLGALFGHSEFTKESTEAPQSDVDLNDEVGIVSLEDLLNQGNGGDINSDFSVKEFSEVNIGLENLFETSENDAFTENMIFKENNLDSVYKNSLVDNLDYYKEGQSFINPLNEVKDSDLDLEALFKTTGEGISTEEKNDSSILDNRENRSDNSGLKTNPKEEIVLQSDYKDNSNIENRSYITKTETNVIETNIPNGTWNREQGFLLSIAAERGLLEMVHHLVDGGADILALNSEGLQPLQLACSNDHTEVVLFLLHKLENFQKAPMYLLQLAAKSGYCDTLEVLLKEGADVNGKDLNGDTALHLAAKDGHLLTVQKLISHGAYIDALNGSSKCPFQEASPTISPILSSTQELFAAVEKNDGTLIKKCIDDGAILNAKSMNNVTPLLQASVKCSGDIVDFMLSRGADPNVSGPEGITPLHHAARRKDGIPIVRILLCYGAVYEALMEDGKTPLQVTCDTDPKCLLRTVDEIFRLLLKGKEFEERVISILKELTDSNDLKAVVRARDRNLRTLVAVAMMNGFSKIDDLRYAVMRDLINFDFVTHWSSCFGRHEVLEMNKRLLLMSLSLFTPDNPIVQEIRLEIAKNHLKLKNDTEASSILKSVCEICKRTVGAGNALSVKAEFLLNRMLTNDGPFDAIFAIEEAVKQKKSNPNQDLNELMRMEIQLEILKFSQNSCSEDHLASLKRVYEKSKSLFGKINSITAYIQIQLGLAYSKLKKPELSLKCLRQSHRTLAQLQGADSMTTLALESHIADALFSQGNAHEAMVHYQNVLKSLTRTVGKRHPFTVSILCKIAQVFISKGKYMGALLIFEEQLALMENNERSGEILGNIYEIRRYFKNEKEPDEWFMSELEGIFTEANEDDIGENSGFLSEILEKLRETGIFQK